VCLSKSIGGYGLPLALTLIKRELDVWEPGEHTGTFRGINPALVTGAAALERYWRDDALERATEANGRRIGQELDALAASVSSTRAQARGVGMVHGLAFERAELAQGAAAAAFERGLLVETAGPENQVIKLLPALTIERDELDRGLELLAEAVHAAC
jgi:diaminobutyrate-2-oxoglutarate transaminase